MRVRSVAGHSLLPRRSAVSDRRLRSPERRDHDPNRPRLLERPLWGRTLCTDDSTGNFSCVTGDCGSGKQECSGSSSAPPATLAEFFLGGVDGLDFFDVSLVDGYNLPMLVVPQGGTGTNCNNTGCVVDLNRVCPSELKVTNAAGSEVVGCKSACYAFNEPQYCCVGAYATPETCKPSSYSQIFKNACPLAYSYAYDDKTSRFTCANANYTITFCPSPNTRLPSLQPEDDPQYTQCKQPFNCGNLTDISYPFWGGSNRPKECGRLGFELTNCEDETQLPHIVIEKLDFHVSNINSQELLHTMTIARSDLWDSPCTDLLVNTTLDYNRFSYVPTVRNYLTLYYGCLPQNESVLNNFTCTAKDTNISYYVDDSLARVDVPGRPTCSTKIIVPIFWEGFDVMPDNATEEVEKVLKQGFQVEYSADWDLCRSCMNSNGTCVSNATTDSFLCLCGNRPNNSTCLIVHGSKFDWKWKVVVGICSVIGTIAVMCVIFFIWRRRNRNRYGPSSYASRSIYSKSYSRSDTEKGSAYLGVHVFTYKELEQATNYFDSSKEIGDGGFGTVYYGKVRDGRSVAVKRLYETNYKRVEQFMNEIEILARLRHQNLVLLYGCTSRHSRELLLVYEYVPNGTLADHLHGGKAKPGALPWHTRINIAVETASALSYLHASEIIHRDVKTTNILLDNNFCVKVADFGLSRLFPTDVTHISTAPQGTPGYVDPDYNQCYQLTAKSDVYSFGVVLVELISSLPAVDITRHRHEINLSNMAINKIQKHALHELVDPSLGYESDFKVRKMINAVAELAFQCLQSETEMRPSMVDVENELKRIQSDDFSKEKAEEIDISADDVVPLKSGPLPPSPDSVTINWVSKSSTPNDSTG